MLVSTLKGLKKSSFFTFSSIIIDPMYFVMHLGLQASFGDKEWEVIQIFS